eukprot:6184803-Pleurochrysis_carterae.AAC.1
MASPPDAASVCAALVVQVDVQGLSPPESCNTSLSRRNNVSECSLAYETVVRGVLNRIIQHCEPTELGCRLAAAQYVCPYASPPQPPIALRIPPQLPPW